MPKSVSDSGRHWPDPSHTEGASAIHSAELVSGAAIVSVLEELVAWVKFRMRIETCLPLTETEADTVSPGATRTPSLTAAAGTSSYHAK